jgi:hypothetical protein
MIEKLAAAWGISVEAARDVLARLDVRMGVKKWIGGETFFSLTHAGVIDNGHSDKTHGHNGYWIADVTTENVCSVTNGDPVWSDWSEETADEIGAGWGQMAEELEQYKI